MYRFATEHEEAALKIIDLGAAIKGMGHQSFKGTPAYASYENIHRLPENEFSDTFVLGLLIHFLFAGNSPMTIVDPSRGKKDFDLYTVENEPYDLANYPKVVERLSELGINQNNFCLLINLALLQKTTISDTQGEKLTPTQLAERFASLFPTTPPEVL